MRKLFIVLAFASLSFAGTYNEKTKVWTPAPNENQFGMQPLVNFMPSIMDDKEFALEIGKLQMKRCYPIQQKVDENAPASPKFLQCAQKKGYILKKSNGKYFSWRDLKNANHEQIKDLQKIIKKNP